MIASLYTAVASAALVGGMKGREFLRLSTVGGFTRAVPSLRTAPAQMVDPTSSVVLQNVTSS